MALLDVRAEFLTEMKMRAIRKFFARFHHGIIYPPFNDPISYRPLRIKNRRLQLLAGFFSFLFRSQYDWCVNDRIIELPFVFENLKLPCGSRVLDFGCDASRISMHLANLGYQVVGTDLLEYSFSHPNFEFRQGDFFSFSSRLETGSFDGIVAVSSVEHVGLGAYGEQAFEKRGDLLVMNEFGRLLRPGGRLILTVPFGRKRVTRIHRVYDSAELHLLLSGFAIETERYYLCEGKKNWMPAEAWELATAPECVDWNNGAALIAASRGAPAS